MRSRHFLVKYPNIHPSKVFYPRKLITRWHPSPARSSSPSVHTLSLSAKRTKPFSENSFLAKRQRTRSKQYAVPYFSLRYNTDFVTITSICAFEFEFTAFPLMKLLPQHAQQNTVTKSAVNNVLYSYHFLPQQIYRRQCFTLGLVCVLTMQLD